MPRHPAHHRRRRLHPRSSCRQKRPAEHVLPAPKGGLDGGVALADGHADDARGEAAGAPLETAGVRGEVEGGGYCAHEGEAADEGVEVGGLLGTCSCSCSRGFILLACACACAAAACACVGSGAAAAAPFASCCSTRRWQQHVTTTTILPVSLEVATATALVFVLVSLLSLSTLLLLSTLATATTAVPSTRTRSALVEHHHLDVE